MKSVFGVFHRETKRIICKNESVKFRRKSSNVATAIKTPETNGGGGKHPIAEVVKTATEKYEDFSGLTEVKIAQQQVLEAERDFTRTQQLRREKQNEIDNLQIRLRDIHLDLDKTSRGDDRYLHLLTQEHAIIKQEQSTMDELRRLDRAERHCFNVLSNRLRESHEKERTRGERTKYMSVVGSLFGAIVGITAGTAATRMKMKDLKKVVEDSTPKDAAMQETVAQLSNTLQAQQQQTTEFILDLKTILKSDPDSLIESLKNVSSQSSQQDSVLRDWVSPQQSQAIKTALDSHDNKLESDMQEIKKLIAFERGYKFKNDGDIVYVGPEMRSLLDKTEKNLETKLRMNSLIGVVLVYGALSVTVPVLYVLFRGT